MALGIHFDHLIGEGVVADQAEIARLGYVSRARVTQIMNLSNLAPDIQEELLFLRVVGSGRPVLTERNLRLVMLRPDWAEQRKLWLSLAIVPHVNDCL